MKDYKEMSESVLKRVHEYEQSNESSHARVRTFGKASAIVLPVLAVAAVGTFALVHGFGRNDISTSDDTSRNDTVAGGAKESIGNDGSGSPVFAGDYWVVDSSESNAEVTAVTSTSEAKAPSSSSSESKAKAPSSSSSESKAESSSSALDSSELNPNERVGGSPMIAAIPNNNRTQVIGEKITEEEARDYFTKNAASLESSLAASGVEIAEKWYDGSESNFMGTVLCAKGSLLFKKGYCHISYDGNTDESKPGLTVKQNFMDFHVYNAGRLVAIVTLVKENGLIYGTSAFGAPWFNSFNNALNKYAGQKVLFLYAGAMAYAIAPDGKVIHPQGYESSVKASGLDTFPNAYNWFYNEQCVYIP